MAAKVTIVDCGVGNLANVDNAFRKLGAQTRLASTPEEIEQAERVVMPGVGAFGYFMEQLRAKNLEEPVVGAIRGKKPFLGICLGMQVLFMESEESPGTRGLGIFSGRAVKFRKGKVPQVGWNLIEPKKGVFLERGYAYFTNSYYCRPEDPDIIFAESDYFGKFACAIQKDNVLAVQFHPERSGMYGLRLLGRWLEC